VDVYFAQASASDPKVKSFILIDSVSSSVTIPWKLYLYQCDFFFYTDLLKIILNHLQCVLIEIEGNVLLLSSVVTVAHGFVWRDRIVSILIFMEQYNNSSSSHTCCICL